MNNHFDKYDLPQEWSWTTIGDVAETTSGGTPSRNRSNYFGGDIPWVKSGELRDGIITSTEEGITPEGLSNSSAKLFPTGTVLVALYGATVGKTGILGLDATTNQAVCGLNPKNKSFIPKYMVYWLQLQRDYLIGQSAGGAQPNINQAIVRATPFPFAPLQDQERVVEKIEEMLTQLDAGVSALKRVQANLKRYKASVLKAACEGRLVTTEAELARREDRPYESGADLLRRILAERREKWAAEQRSRGKDPAKMKYEEPRGPESENLPELPEGWCWATVEQVGDHRLGKMLDKQKNKGELRPYLRNANVRWFSFDLDDIQYMRVDEGELNEVTVEKGDVVICEGGEPGRAAVWEKNERFVIQKALHRVRLPKGIVPWYLVYYLSYSANTGILEKYFTGSTIKHFTGESLRSFVFALPPFDEQCRIVAEIENRFVLVTKNEVVVGKTAIRADRLRQSILKRAFEGRLVGETEKTSAV